MREKIEIIKKKTKVQYLSIDAIFMTDNFCEPNNQLFKVINYFTYNNRIFITYIPATELFSDIVRYGLEIEFNEKEVYGRSFSYDQKIIKISFIEGKWISNIWRKNKYIIIEKSEEEVKGE